MTMAITVANVVLVIVRKRRVEAVKLVTVNINGRVSVSRDAVGSNMPFAVAIGVVMAVAVTVTMVVVDSITVIINGVIGGTVSVGVDLVISMVEAVAVITVAVRHIVIVVSLSNSNGSDSGSSENSHFS